MPEAPKAEVPKKQAGAGPGEERAASPSDAGETATRAIAGQGASLVAPPPARRSGGVLGKLLAPVRRSAEGALGSRVVGALVSPGHIDDYLQMADPTWSLREVRARIERVVDETPDAMSLWLRPNGRWRGFKPGQHVALSVYEDGVRHTRVFSLSSSPEQSDALRLTIKRHPGGRIAGWLHNWARPDTLVWLGQATGEFCLDTPTPQRLLFISGGSGITPLVSIAHHLAATGYTGRLHWLHYARDHVILGAELDALREALPGLHLRIVDTAEHGAGSQDISPTRHFDPADLQRWLPDFAQCETYACGPLGLLDAVGAHFETAGLSAKLHVERFTVARAPRVDGDASADERHQVRFERSDAEHTYNASDTLLEQAERAGLTPPSGCRIGICHSCVCRKVSGAVQDIRTGEINDEPDQQVQLCVNTPRSDVVLEL